MSVTPTGQRQLAIDLTASDPKKALSVARAVDDPWFKCQALAHVARYWPGDDYKQILREANNASDSQDNWYKRVTVSAWPIRAYLERGDTASAKRLLARYTSEARNIENMGGRSEALLMLFQAAKPYDRSLWEPVLQALIEATEPALAWRQLRNTRIAVAMVAADSSSLVQQAIKRLTDDKAIAAIKRDTENGKTAEPRAFF